MEEKYSIKDLVGKAFKFTDLFANYVRKENQRFITSLDIDNSEYPAILDRCDAGQAGTYTFGTLIDIAFVRILELNQMDDVLVGRYDKRILDRMVPYIAVKLHRDPDYVITITDNGPGYDETSMWESGFIRSHPHSPSLNGVKQFSEMYGGSVSYERTEHDISVFTVRLPENIEEVIASFPD